MQLQQHAHNINYCIAPPSGVMYLRYLPDTLFMLQLLVTGRLQQFVTDTMVFLYYILVHSSIAFVEKVRYCARNEFEINFCGTRSGILENRKMN